MTSPNFNLMSTANRAGEELDNDFDSSIDGSDAVDIRMSRCDDDHDGDRHSVTVELVHKTSGAVAARRFYSVSDETGDADRLRSDPRSN